MVIQTWSGISSGSSSLGTNLFGRAATAAKRSLKCFVFHSLCLLFGVARGPPPCESEQQKDTFSQETQRCWQSCPRDLIPEDMLHLHGRRLAYTLSCIGRGPQCWRYRELPPYGCHCSIVLFEVHLLFPYRLIMVILFWLSLLLLLQKLLKKET